MAQDAVAEIKSRLDIIDVVGSYVRLQRSGQEHKGLCPFHSEKSPSFQVNPHKQMWYCHGCSQGGDLFAFVEKIENVDFRQALEMLADRAGVELERTVPGHAKGAKRRRILELNARAAAFYEHVLWKLPAGADGRELLQRRGVDEELAHRFGIGFAPAGGRSEDALARYLQDKAAASGSELVDAGLAHPARAGRLRDRFRRRLIFPIRDERGEVIAFGARALGDAVPKYLNSPETAAYSKSTALFGLDLARTALQQAGSVVVVEGYFDVVAAHRAGVENVIASSGTALTREQVHRLARSVSTVLLCFDGDDAGRRAADRAVDIVAAEGLQARIVSLPGGAKDPDEVVQKDPAALAAAIEAAAPEWQVLLDAALVGAEGGSIEARRQASERVVGLLARIPEAATRSLYVQQASRRLELPAQALGSDVERRRGQAAAPVRYRVEPVAVPVAPAPVESGAPSSLAAQPLPEWERYVAMLVVHRPSLARTFVEEMGLRSELLGHPGARRLLEIGLAVPPGDAFPTSSVTEEERNFAASLLVRNVPELDGEGDPVALERAMRDCVALVVEAEHRAEILDLKRQMAAAKERGDAAEVQTLATRLRELAAASPRLRRSVGPV